MRQLFYFLIGFCIPFVFSYVAYATTEFSDSDLSLIQSYWNMSQNQTGNFHFMENSQAASAAYYNYSPPSGWNVVESCNRAYADWGFWMKLNYNPSLDQAYMHKYWEVWVYGRSDPDADTDGDGIPDDCDVYPDDPTDYQVRRSSYQKDSSGNIVRECYITDRDDVVCLGESYNNSLVDYVEFSSPWQSPSTLCAYSDNFSDPSDDEQDVDGDGIPDGADDGDGVPFNDDGIPDSGGNDDEMTDGTPSDGTEDLDLQKIIDNTAATTDNVSRLADYLQEQNSDLNQVNSNLAQIKGALDGFDSDLGSINSYLGSINSGVGSINSSLGAIESDLNVTNAHLADMNGDLDTISGHLLTSNDHLSEISDSLEITSDDISTSVNNIGNTDTVYQSAQDNITTVFTLVDDAPDDYQEKRNLSEKIADYISSNPLSNIIENSGVEITGSTSTASFDYNGHSIILSVAGFDSQLEAFGQILLGISTLAGMLLVFRGF